MTVTLFIHVHIESGALYLSCSFVDFTETVGRLGCVSMSQARPQAVWMCPCSCLHEERDLQTSWWGNEHRCELFMLFVFNSSDVRRADPAKFQIWWGAFWSWMLNEKKVRTPRWLRTRIEWHLRSSWVGTGVSWSSSRTWWRYPAASRAAPAGPRRRSGGSSSSLTRVRSQCQRSEVFADFVCVPPAQPSFGEKDSAFHVPSSPAWPDPEKEKLGRTANC